MNRVPRSLCVQTSDSNQSFIEIECCPIFIEEIYTVMAVDTQELIPIYLAISFTKSTKLPPSPNHHRDYFPRHHYYVIVTNHHQSYSRCRESTPLKRNLQSHMTPINRQLSCSSWFERLSAKTHLPLKIRTMSIIFRGTSDRLWLETLRWWLRKWRIYWEEWTKETGRNWPRQSLSVSKIKKILQN